MNFESDIKIDKYSLDVECERQAMLYVKWSEKYADAIYERDKAKEQLDIVRAEIDKDIRSNYTEYGFDKKPTENAINATIITNKKYLEYNNKLINANKNVNILAAAKEALNHKKRMLESLVQLWLGGYYAEPKIDVDAKNVFSKSTKNAINRKLKKSRRIMKK